MIKNGTNKNQEITENLLLALIHDEKMKDAPHCFHFNCILPWIERNQTCPVCRRTISKAELSAIISLRKILKIDPDNISEAKENDILTLLPKTYYENTSGTVKFLLNGCFTTNLLNKVFNIIDRMRIRFY